MNSALQQVIDESGIKRGFLLLRSPHSTAALICNERDPDVHEDLKSVLEGVIPANQAWRHSYEGNINARAHQAVAYLGTSEWAPVESGQLKLGTWQELFLVELFEPRQRRVDVVIVGE